MIEKEQLIEQGFELIGDEIEAKSGTLALEKFTIIQSGKNSIFHFFQKDETVVHLDISSSSFINEKDQLIEQGFERRGEPIHAKSIQQAYKKFNKAQHDELYNSSTFLGASTSAGASNFLRFVTEIDPKKKSL